MKQYLDLLQDVLDNGTVRDDRTGVGTIATFGRQIRFNMQDGFPAVTTKALAFRAMCSELLWFLEGSTNEHRLAEIKNDNKPYAELTEKERKTIWTANYENQGKALGYTDGELGRIYGSQWCNFRGVKEIKDPMYKQDGSIHGYNVYYQTVEVNQIKNIINEIKNNPNSRRLVVSAWNPVDLPTMALAPCHYSFQFDVDGDKLSLMWSQRSVDCGTGLPFNIASYALLLHIVARMTGKIPHELIGSLGNTHIYKNHIEQVKEQLTRTPHKLPQLELPANADYSDIDSFLKSVKTSDFKLLNYEHDAPLKYPMAV
jgi:thymidylate synthase